MSPGLIRAATGSRHGLLLPPVDVPLSAADMDGVFHSSVAMEGEAFRSAGGGVARTRVDARTAAVGEALERYAATHATLDVRQRSSLGTARCVPLEDWSLHSPAQRAAPHYPHDDAFPADEWLTEVYDLTTNQSLWVPAALVSMVDDFGALSTSSGLAADPDPHKALLRALQEIVERDAYMSTWLHQLGGRLVAQGSVDDRLGGDQRVYDLTPAFSPHPVAAVTGTLDLDGHPRHSLGVACRSTWDEAVERATLEMVQGTMFVGQVLHRRPELRGITAADVTGFDEHAVFYAANPTSWPELPIHRFAEWAPVPTGRSQPTPTEELAALVDALAGAGVRLMYRDLTTVDVAQLGITVVRVLSPDLTPIHHDHRWPFLGGRTPDLIWRYPDGLARRGDRTFPSPFPHALG